METVREEIKKIKGKYKAISSYYQQLSLMLKQLNSKIAGILLYPSQNVYDILEQVRNYNFEAQGLYNNMLTTDKENTAFHIVKKDIVDLLIKFDEANVIKNLIDKDFTKKRLHTTHIVTDKLGRYKGDDCYYYSTVAFSVFCNDNIDENKLYTIEEINALINEGELVMYSPLHFDSFNKNKYTTYCNNTNEILKNLDKINFPKEYEDRIEYISEKELSKLNLKIKNNINLFSIFYYIKDLIGFQFLDTKKDLKENISVASNYYSSLESVLCSNAVYQISNKIKEVKQKMQENKEIYKQKVKDLLYLTSELEDITELEKEM